MRKPYLMATVFLIAACMGGISSETKAATSELVQMLVKTLGVTPEQASGGAGALFGLAQKQLKPEDFGKVAAVVPDMSGLLKSAPKAEGLSSSLGSMGSMVPGSAGGMATVLDQFKALGLTPEMVGKFAPVITKFVESKGGPKLASLLASAWK